MKNMVYSKRTTSMLAAFLVIALMWLLPQTVHAQSIEIEKRMVTPPTVTAGGLISFTIRITNSGGTAITTLPVTDTYDPAYLSFDPVADVTGPNRADDSIDDGIINWSNAILYDGSNQLDPNERLDLTVVFAARSDTVNLPGGVECESAGYTYNVATANGISDCVEVPIAPGEAKLKLGDLIWHDINGNGTQDANEPGIDGVLVNLYELDGTLNRMPASLVTATTITTGTGGSAVSGFYEFEAISGRNYEVEIDASNFAPGGPLEGFDIGSDQNSNQGLTIGDTVISRTVAQLSVNDDTLDFGYYCRYDLALIKELIPGQPSLVQSGDLVSYLITVKNQGTINSGRVTIFDQIPTGMSARAVNMTSDGLAPGGDVALLDFTSLSLSAVITDLVPNGTALITLTVEVVDANMAPFRNWAEITTDSGDDIDSDPGDNNGNDNGAGDGGTGGDPVVDHNDIDHNPPNDNRNVDEDDSDYAEVDVNVSYDLALIKELAPGQASLVQAGEEVDYVIKVLNQGNVPSGAITVRDLIPAGMSYRGASASAAVADLDIIGVNGSVFTTIMTDLAPSGMGYITLTLRVDDVTQAPFRNWAEISTDSGDDVDSDPADNNGNDSGPGDGGTGGDPVVNHNDINHNAPNDDRNVDEDDSDFEDVDVNITYDLALVKDLAPGQGSTVQLGEEVNYVIKVLNQGNVPSGAFTIRDQIPTGMSYMRASVTAPVSDLDIVGVNGSVFTTVMTDLVPSGTGYITLTLRVDDVTQAPFRNWAEISTDSGDDVDSDPGDNNGNDNGPGDGGIGGDPVVDHNDIDHNAPNNDRNVDEDDSDYADVDVNVAYDLALIKDLAPGQGRTVQLSEEVDYVIKVLNQGNVPSGRLIVRDQIPAGMSYVQASVTAPVADIDIVGINGSIFTTIMTDLVPSGMGYITLTLRVDDVTQAPFRNWAEISTDSGDDVDSDPGDNNGNDNGPGDGGTGADPVVDHNDIDHNPPNEDRTVDEDDSDYADVVIQGEFDLALRKSIANGQAASANPGDAVIFAITLFNQGTLDAFDIDVIDYIPAGSAYTSSNAATVTNSSASNPIVITDNGGGAFEIDSLAANDSITFEVTLTIDVGFQGNALRNWAEIADASDTDGGTTATDVDSTPNGTNFNDLGETDDLLDDDVISESGKNGGDEDDHDPAEIAVQQLVAVGNIVWLDDGAGGGIADNGILDGTESGIDNVTLLLFNQGDDPLMATAIATTTTAGGGFYQFDDLMPGQYFVHIPAAEFQTGGELVNHLSSTDNGTDETTDQTGDENGIDDADPATNGISSTNFDLQPNSEVTGEDQASYTGILDDDNVNFTADFGFTVSNPIFDLALIKVTDQTSAQIGDLVTFTIYVKNQGTVDATDVEICDWVPEGFVAPTTANNPDSNWDFVPPYPIYTIPNLDAGQTVSFTLAMEVDTDATANNLTNQAGVRQSDRDDTGAVDERIDEDGTFTGPSTVPPTTNVIDQLNPTDVDIDLVPGDDDDHDIASVTLVDPPGLEVSKTLSGTGPFSPGVSIDFIIHITNPGDVAITTLPLTDTYDVNYLTYDTATDPMSANPATEPFSDGSIFWANVIDFDDDNQLDPDEVLTLTVRFTARAETTNLPGSLACEGPGNTYNVVMAGGVESCVEVPIEPSEAKLKLGDVIWHDIDQDGAQDPNELGINGVLVNLYELDSTFNRVPGSLITTTTTTTGTGGSLASGFYEFDVISKRNYEVEVDASNFAPGGPLAGFFIASDQNANQDLTVGATVASRTVVQITNSDDTLDFGYYCRFDLALTKRLAAGQAPAIEPGSDMTFTITIFNQGVVTATNIEIADYVPTDFSLSNHDSNGWTPAGGTGTVTNSLNVTLTPSGTVGASTTVDIVLRADALAADGDYINTAEIVDYVSSVTDTDGNDLPDADSDPDNADGNTPGEQPPNLEDNQIDEDGKNVPGDDEDDHDPAIVTVASVFYSVGNQVFEDGNNNAVKDPTEPGIPGVTVILFDPGNTPNDASDDLEVTRTDTVTDGLYLFDGVAAGDYYVKVADENFEAGGSLVGYDSSDDALDEDNPEDDGDGNDNGLPMDGMIVSGIFTLGEPTDPEPTGENPDNDPNTPDDQENLTIDFGFVPPAPSIAVSKRLNGENPFSTGAIISFTIRVTNTGNIVITSLPLEDRYLGAFITYQAFGTFPQPDSVADSVLVWNDLLANDNDGLAVGEAVTIVVYFETAADTSRLTANPPCTAGGHAPNVAHSVGGMAGLVPVIEDADDEACDSVRILKPTAVQLASGSLAQTSKGVVVRWQVADESNVVGFYVWKSNGMTSTRSNEMIPIQVNGQSTETGDYEWLDAGATLKQGDAYTLEIVKNDGMTTRTMIDVVSGGYTFLPLVRGN
ncbi:MAG: SdrD B-like domain-containing protein [Chloroflexota bacterium]